MEDTRPALNDSVQNSRYDVCPIMSIGQNSPVFCSKNCAWYDTGCEECAVSRINANLKYFENISGCPDQTYPEKVTQLGKD